MLWFAQIAALAAAYFISGKLGLLLAVPPGYATFIFPASGIALACILVYRYRLLPGVWLGSFLMNVSLSFNPSSAQEFLAAALLPALIGLGAMTQAAFGAFLIGRFVGFPAVPEKREEIYRFFIAAGPVSCLVGASVGVTSLLAGSVITGPDYLSHWFTWWSGDVVGVFVFAPLVLMLLAEPRDWWRRRLVTVGFPLSGAFALLTVVYLLLSYNEAVQLRRNFERQADAMVNALQTNISLNTEVLDSVAGVFRASESVSREEFSALLEYPLSYHKGIQAVAWAPRVRASERETFLKRAGSEGFNTFRLTEQAADGSMVEAGMRHEYYPVWFVEPYSNNKKALGFDLASGRVRQEAMLRAAATGRPAATAPVSLVAERKGLTGFLSFFPIYTKGLPAATVEERRRAVQGFAVIVFTISDLVAAAVEGDSFRGISLVIHDSGGPEGKSVVPIFPQAQAAARTGENDRRLRYRQEIGFVDRRWILEFSSTAAFIDPEMRAMGSLFPLGAMATTGLFTVFLFVISGYESAAARLVRERTAELTRTNEALARTNAELEQFAYVASHDLREPLRRITSFTELFAKKYRGAMDPDADRYIFYIVEGAERMESLIRDLISYSSVTTGEKEFRPVDCNALLAAVLKSLAPAVAEAMAHISSDPLPVITADPVQMAQVFRNLISNAVKFRGDAALQVHVSAVPVQEFQPGRDLPAEIGGHLRAMGRGWVFSVRDNGIGIDPQYHGKIFRIFQRLHPRMSYPGTGMGLAICKKVIERHGGQLWVESGAGKGSTFFFTIQDNG
ncbi:MAG: CHASE domain-containing protein [Thermodesulfovibrionales bacterium]|jgi:signal transduction histidine kinase